MKNTENRFFYLRNNQGVSACFTPYGARWTGMKVPDKNGIIDDVILGFNSVDEYCNAEEKYHGAIVGRVCGRIRNASFMLNGKKYILSANENNKTHLHGGHNAFHNALWETITGKDLKDNEFIKFKLNSPNGSEGYPSNLNVTVTYTLTQNNILRMECRATSDTDTIVNLTNHAFFNLCGTLYNNDVFQHRLFINSSELIECDKDLIPTGVLLPTANTPLDFSINPHIANSLRTNMYDIKNNKGFTLAYKLDQIDDIVQLAATLSEEKTGRKLSIYTNQPSLQVYTGYYMTGKDIGKAGFPYYSGSGIALETQGFPDAVHHHTFPSIVLKKGDEYLHITEYHWQLI